ncbi:MAG TPA: amidohydrolase family protein [Acidimicrobiales bacterium]|nr:amidohydrolase family protein [Acidimicrobiales bacterium]
MASLVLRGAGLIDGTGAGRIGEAVVALENDRIAQVGGRPPGGPELDVAGLTVLPGLIDAHAHVTLVDLSDLSGRRTPVAVTAARIFHVCDVALDAGFTTVRDAGGADGGLATAIATGLVRGPRILPSGPILCQSGGHGDLRDPFDGDPLDHHGRDDGLPGLVQASMRIDGADGARIAAREVFRRGATQLKVAVSGGVVSTTDRIEDTQLTIEELAAVVAEAEARGTYVLAHAHNVGGIRNGLVAGVRSFEHASLLDEETAQAIAAAGAYVVPTLAVLHLMEQQWQEWGLPEAVLPRLAGLEEAMGRSVKLAAAAGVPLGSGSDLLGPEQRHRGMELTLKSRLVGPMDALISATRTNAELLGREDDIGTVTEGKLADLVAFDGDPVQDPELFDQPERVVLVVQGGKVVKDLRA